MTHLVSTKALTFDHAHLWHASTWIPASPALLLAPLASGCLLTMLTSVGEVRPLVDDMPSCWAVFLG